MSLIQSWCNTLLNDEARYQYTMAIQNMKELCPEMMSRKIDRANVQQAFVCQFVASHYVPGYNVLSVGCYEDTAYETLRKMEIPVLGIDPMVDGNTLDSFFWKSDPKRLFNIIFSTSVIEHVDDDETFIRQICNLLKPGGYACITMDFLDSYSPGQEMPATAVRFYTESDLEHRLRDIIESNGCKYLGDTNWTGTPDFWYQGHTYSLATMVFYKEI